MWCRNAQRTLTGVIIPVGGRPPDIRIGPHASGIAAVTVDLRGPNGTRTFTDPAALWQLAAELHAVAKLLEEEHGRFNVLRAIAEGYIDSDDAEALGLISIIRGEK